MSAINAIKEALKTDNDIEKNSNGYIVWDKYGMIVADKIETLDEAVDILFNHTYAA